MGNYLQHISDRVSIVASPRLWLEDAAVQQLNTTAALPGMQRVVGLPDLHPGRGYPVGAAFFSSGLLYPALVGNDIGCGMGLWQTDLAAARVKLDKLDKRLGNLDQPPDAAEWATLAQRDAALPMALEALEEQLADAGLDPSHLRSLGTIGGGNHFAELQLIDKIGDELMTSSVTSSLRIPAPPRAWPAPACRQAACNCWCTAVRAAWGRRFCAAMSMPSAMPDWRNTPRPRAPTWRNMPPRCVSPKSTAA